MEHQLKDKGRGGNFAKIKHVYFLSGEEGSKKAEFIRKIKKEMGLSNVGAIDFLDFDASVDIRIGDVLVELETPSFFGATKMVYLRSAHELGQEDKKKLAEYIKRPSDFACLVLDVKLLAKDDLLFDGAEEDQIVACGRIQSDEMGEWVEKSVRRAGKNIEPQAVRDLIEYNNAYFEEVRNSLQKVLLYIGKKDVICLRDVRQVVTDQKALSIFALTDALAAKNSGKAIDVLSNILDGGHEARNLIGTLAWHFRRIWTAKSLMERSGDSHQIAKKLKIPHRYFDGFAGTARSFSHGRLKDIFARLLETDIMIRKKELNEKTALEMLCFELCQ